MQEFPIEKIIAAFEKRLSADEQLELNNWLAESEANKQFYEETRKVHSASEKTRLSFKPNPILALQKVNKGLSRRRMSHWSYAAAAIFVMAVLIGRFLIWSPTPMLEIVAQNRQVIYLSDSSKVILAANTTLKFPEKFDKKQRQVQLNGKAYFEVKKDVNRPFLVHTSNTQVKVLGTRFLVDASRKENEKVWVDEGKVAFTAFATKEAQPTILSKSEVGSWTAGTQIISEKPFSNINKNAWLSGRLSFENNTLTDVVKELSKFFDINIKLEKAIENRKYTGSFTNASSAEESLRVLCFSLNLRVQKNNNNYLITP